MLPAEHHGQGITMHWYIRFAANLALCGTGDVLQNLHDTIYALPDSCT